MTNSIFSNASAKDGYDHELAIMVAATNIKQRAAEMLRDAKATGKPSLVTAAQALIDAIEEVESVADNAMYENLQENTDLYPDLISAMLYKE